MARTHRGCLWALLAVLIAVIALLDFSGRLATASHTTALCPSSPMCSRAGAPRVFRGKYCESLLSQLMSFFSPGGRSAGGRKELPYYEDRKLSSHVLREAEQLLATHLVGQGHVVGGLLEAVRRKLQYPSEPLVLHFAGDNGVGKTFTARLLSLAMSLRCAADRDVCDAGDNLLSISGASFDGLSVADARRVIVGRVLHHVDNHPHGIVLIDDFTAMDPALVPVLAPLFGRADHYPEQFLPAPRGGSGKEDGERLRSRAEEAGSAVASAAPGDDRGEGHRGGGGKVVWQPPSLGQLVVIITTDLGQQGRTMGMSASAIEQLVRDSFAELYGSLLPAYTRTFAYLPFTTDIAASVVRSAVANLPCTVGVYAPAAAGSRRASTSAAASLLSSVTGGGPGRMPRMSVTAASIDEVAVSYLVEKHRAAWQGKENGHALRRVVEDELVAQLLAYEEERGLDSRLLARFVLDERRMAVVLDGAHAGDGRLSEDGGGGGSWHGHDL